MAEGAETRLVRKMRKAGDEKYAEAFVSTKYPSSSFGETGTSDLLCTLHGISVCVEVKAPESYKVRGAPSVHKALAKGPTLKQRLFVNKQIKAGACAGFAASVEQFMVILACAHSRARNPLWKCEGHWLDVQWPDDERFPETP